MRYALYLCLGLMGMLAFSAPAHDLILHILDLIALEGGQGFYDALAHTAQVLLATYTIPDLILTLSGPVCFALSFVWAGIIFLVPMSAKLRLVLVMAFLGALLVITMEVDINGISPIVGAFLGFMMMALLILLKRIRLVGQIQQLLRAYYLPELVQLDRKGRIKLSTKRSGLIFQSRLLPAPVELNESMRLAALHALNTTDLTLRRNRALLELSQLCQSTIARPICCSLWGYTIALTDLPFVVQALGAATQGNLTILRRVHDYAQAYIEAAQSGKLNAQMKRFARNHLTAREALALKVNLKVIAELLLEHIPTKLELFAAESQGQLAQLDAERCAFSTEAVLQAWRYDQDLSHITGNYHPNAQATLHTTNRKVKLTPEQQHCQALRVALYHELSLSLSAGHHNNPPNAYPPVRQRVTDWELLQVSFDVSVIPHYMSRVKGPSASAPKPATPSIPLNESAPAPDAVRNTAAFNAVPRNGAASNDAAPNAAPDAAAFNSTAGSELSVLPNAMLTVVTMGRLRVLGLLRLLAPLCELMVVLTVLWGLLQDVTVQALLEFQAHHYLNVYAEAIGTNVTELAAQAYRPPLEDFISHNAVMGLSHEMALMPLTLYSEALLSGYNLWLLCLLLTLVVGALLILSGVTSTLVMLFRRAQIQLGYSYTLNLLQVYVACAALFIILAVSFAYHSKLVHLWYNVNYDLNALQSELTTTYELKAPHATSKLLTLNGIINRHASEYALGPNGNVKTMRRMGLYSPDTGLRWIAIYAPLHSPQIAEILAQVRREQDQRFFNKNDNKNDGPQRRPIEHNASVTTYRLTLTPRLHVVVDLQPLALE